MHLDRLISYKGPKGPVLLVIADGVGLAEPGPANAVSLAHTPVIDRLLAGRHATRLHAHGTWVGLPGDGDMGNSEVGHNTLGAGRVFDQGAKRVNAALASGDIFDGEAWREVERRGAGGATVHFLGLLSDGNVHSHTDHLYALLARCRDVGVASVAVHVLLDGRDVAPRSAPGYVSALQQRLDEINRGTGFNYRIAGGGGRMLITMDRYGADWDMVERGYRVHVLGETGDVARAVTDPLAEIERQYEADPELNDQYLSPFVVVDESGPVGAMRGGDAVVLFNFRGDRAVEISQALEDPAFDHFARTLPDDLYFCGMLEYDGDLKTPKHYLVEPPSIDRTMGEFTCGEGLKTFAVSETQKFGHVTYFWNGNRSGYIDETLETYVEIPSDNVPFDQAPEMKAVEITDATLELLDGGQYRFGRINFANGDMVAHTGDVEATVKALECVDRCLGRLVEAVERLDGVLVFTADHGNADEMFVEQDGRRVTRTSHTLNPVPLAIHCPAGEDKFSLTGEAAGLGNVAATLLNLMGYRAPEGYEPSIVRFADEPNRRLIYRGRVVNLGMETIHLPNEDMMAMEVVRHPGGAVVLACNDAGEICVLRQFRHAAGGWIWELPAGMRDDHEPPLVTARRELKEEAGLSATDWRELGSTLTAPGFCDERLYVFYAGGLASGDTAREAHEFMEMHWLTLERLEEMILNGEMDDAKSIVAVHRARRAGLLGD